MAIDDNTSYELTGAQVKDLAARIKAGGGGMIVYVDASFESPSSITNVFSDSGLTTVADWEDMADVILAGGTVIAVYDNGSNKHQYVELVSVTVNDNVAVGKRFAGVISSGVGETSPPLTIFLYYNDSLATPRWFAEGASLPTVNDATLTIQHNGTNVQTFTANQSTNATANIETIWADDIEATTPVPAVETAMIADGAVTGAKLDTQSYNLASVPTHSFGTNVYSLIRVANIVILNFRLWQSGAVTDYAWNNVCTIPSALYPSKDCRGIITVLNGNNGQTISVCRAQLTTAGQISAYPTANGGTSIIGWEGLFVWTI